MKRVLCINSNENICINSGLKVLNPFAIHVNTMQIL